MDAPFLGKGEGKGHLFEVSPRVPQPLPWALLPSQLTPQPYPTPTSRALGRFLWGLSSKAQPPARVLVPQTALPPLQGRFLPPYPLAQLHVCGAGFTVKFSQGFPEVTGSNLSVLSELSTLPSTYVNDAYHWHSSGHNYWSPRPGGELLGGRSPTLTQLRVPVP